MTCTRCDGTGEVLWFGTAGPLGPCPKCRPLATADLAARHAARTWPTGRIPATTQGARHGTA